MPKVNVITQGCSSNLRESELMMGLLNNSGYDISNDENKLIVAGCITESIVPKIKEINESVSFVNTHNFGRISTVVENSLNGTVLELLDKKYEQKVNLPSVRKNPVVGIVPILNGCNYFCTF